MLNSKNKELYLYHLHTLKRMSYVYPMIHLARKGNASAIEAICYVKRMLPSGQGGCTQGGAPGSAVVSMEFESQRGRTKTLSA